MLYYIIVPLENARSKEPLFSIRQSCIHVIPFPVLLFILGWRWWWRRRLLFDEIFSVQRACGVQLQPGRYTLQVEHVVFVAW